MLEQGLGLRCTLESEREKIILVGRGDFRGDVDPSHESHGLVLETNIGSTVGGDGVVVIYTVKLSGETGCVNDLIYERSKSRVMPRRRPGKKLNEVSTS